GRPASGSWVAARGAAGLVPHRCNWTGEEVIVALQRWAGEHGRPPRDTESLAAGRDHPPSSTVKNTFGGWSAALEVAGLPAFRHGAWEPEEVLEGLRAVARDHGRPPRTPELGDTREVRGSWATPGGRGTRREPR